MPPPTRPVNDRLKFVAAQQDGLYSMAELCRRYGISRQTGYKWVRRYEAHGVEGLKEGSHIPHTCPHRTASEFADALIEARRAHPTWGPRKILPWLLRKRPELEGALPAASTVGDLFRRNGLVEPRRRRRRSVREPVGPIRASAANDLWAADYKGQFRMRDGVDCYPLTITDAYSRALLTCDALLSVRFSEAQPSYERCFRENGLPRTIRTDNGPPFASPSLFGLTRLNVWWTRLGIVHERIDPGRPDQNGSHERMHRTLKAEATRPPGEHQAGQQGIFDRFRWEFVHERPHEALGQQTPASLYTTSARAMPECLPKPEYELHCQVRHVRQAGMIKFKGRQIFLTQALVHEEVALEEVDDGVWSIYFYRRLLGRLDERTWKISG